MANNLRIVHKNLADICTITASTVANATTTPVSNLNNDYRSKIYRSSTGSGGTQYATLLIDAGLGNTIAINSIILILDNLSSSATVTVKSWSTPPTSISALIDSAPVITGGTTTSTIVSGYGCKPYLAANADYWNTEVATSATLTRGYSRVYFSTTSARAFTVEIVDSNNPHKFIEISRLVCGAYWSPTYNTSFGLSSGTTDLTTNERTEAGDLVSIIKPSFGTISFDLKYLNTTDKANLQKIIKSVGLSKAVFVSLFPENTDDYSKEQQYQMYGKMTQLFPIEHPLHNMYSSQVDIEEI